MHSYIGVFSPSRSNVRLGSIFLFWFYVFSAVHFFDFRGAGELPSLDHRYISVSPNQTPEPLSIFIYSIVTSEPLLHLNSIQRNLKKKLWQPGSAVTTAKTPQEMTQKFRLK